jgi:hypothetical protein
VKLTNFNYPVHLEELRVVISTATEEIAWSGNVLDFEEVLFSADSHVTYFANIFGKASGGIDLGLFGVKISADFDTMPGVPLPTSLLFMASALVGLGAMGRGGKLKNYLGLKSQNPAMA